jgi:hypothetical protein
MRISKRFNLEACSVGNEPIMKDGSGELLIISQVADRLKLEGYG